MDPFNLLVEAYLFLLGGCCRFSGTYPHCGFSGHVVEEYRIISLFILFCTRISKSNRESDACAPYKKKKNTCSCSVERAID